MTTPTGIRLGAHCLNQGTSWPDLLDAAQRVERAGLDSISVMDHVHPVFNLRQGPTFEAWLTVAAWAATTNRIELGVLVSAVAFRPPALLAKMAATLDHISDGRAFLGIGAGWNGPEHRAYGVELANTASERLAKLEEALEIIRPMLSAGQASLEPGHAGAIDAVNEPKPVRDRLPIIIGGQGTRITMRLVAQYGDGVNVSGTVQTVAAAELAIRQHCAMLGRDDAEIERSALAGVVVIRDTDREARHAACSILGAEFAGQLKMADHPIGSPQTVAARLRPYVELGYVHLQGIFPAPYDPESLARFSDEVRDLL